MTEVTPLYSFFWLFVYMSVDPLFHLSFITTIGERQVSVIIHFTDNKTNAEMSCNLLKVIQRATALSCQCILEIKKMSWK